MFFLETWERGYMSSKSLQAGEEEDEKYVTLRREIQQPLLSFSGLCCCKVGLSSAQWSSWSSAGSDLSTGRQLENSRCRVGISLFLPLWFAWVIYWLPSYSGFSCLSSPCSFHLPHSRHIRLCIFQRPTTPPLSFFGICVPLLALYFHLSVCLLFPCRWMVSCQLEKSLGFVQCFCHYASLHHPNQRSQPST